jgi:peptidyl-prolyl cis-trans isomerase D
MFDSIRSRKWFVQAFLIVIALSFALWGVESYVRDIGGGDSVATVGDSKITQGEFAQALREQQEQLAAALGANYTPELVNSPEARRNLVEQLVNQRLLLLAAQDNKLAVSEAMLAEVIRGIPSLHENGQFSMDRYEALARSRGYTVPGFEAQLRRDLLIQQVLAAVGDSALASKVAFAATHSLLAERRLVAEIRLRPDSYRAGLTITDEAVASYYEANLARFAQPEQLRAAYVVLNPEAIEKQVSVTAEEAQRWYDANRARFAQPEERRASHILIAVDVSATAEAKAAARARAEKLLAEVRARPGDFARLARENSDDPGSAASGGDLGYFARGAMVPAFEEAAFALPDGGLSGVVATDFGFHIIKVTGLNPARDKPFAEVRGAIESELREQAVQRRFAEAAEQFANLAYEQSDSLQALLDQFKLRPAESGWIVRGQPPTTPLLTPKVVAALFADEAIKERRNTEAIEVAPRTLLVARVVDHRPAARLPLGSVRNDIREILVREAAARRAAEAGAARLAELRAGQAANFPKPVEVSRLDTAGLPPAAARAVLDAATDKLPAHVGVELPDGSYGIYRISAVESAAAASDTPQGRALRAELESLQLQQELRAYLAVLRQRYDVSVNPRAIEASRG